MAPPTKSLAVAAVAAVSAGLTAGKVGSAFVAPAGKATEATKLSADTGSQAFKGGAAALEASTSSSAGVRLVALGAAAAAASLVKKPSIAQGQRARRQLVCMEAFENELGVQEPLGFWDPAGLSADGDAASFKRRRSVELKHGRISMMATMGYITPEITGRLPGFLSPSTGVKFADVPNGLAAISKVPAAGWAQIVAYFGIVEFAGGFNDYKSGTPGDYGFKVLTSPDPAEREKKLAAELANGRLAMVAIIGMFFQDGLTGSAWGDWALYTDSPLRSGKFSPGYNTLPEFDKPLNGFEGQNGEQAPLGLWDPLGFTADGNVETFKRRREVEIKHGRVAMLATIGYIVPEYVKLPGVISTSSGLKFADIPNGLAALSKVPVEGWAQIVAFIGFVELKYNEPCGEPGNYGKGFLGLGSLGFSASVQNPDVRFTKLNAELANGRLAMMAIIGMFFQDGLTGSAWGDWALYTASPLR